GDVLAEEVLRDLHVDAGAVAGLAVGVDRAAMPDGLQRGDAGFHHAARRLAVERGNEADAAGVMLGALIPRARRAQLVGVGPPLSDEPLAALPNDFAHVGPTGS